MTDKRVFMKKITGAMLLILFAVLAAVPVCAAAPVPKVKLRDCTLQNNVMVFRFYAADDVDGYLIYRKVDNGAFQKYARIDDSTRVRFTDKEVTSGHSYTYTARAFVDVSGGIKTGTYDKTGITVEYPVSAPVIREVLSADGGIFLAWEAAEEAAGYRVYRKEEGKKYYQFLDSVGKRNKTFYKDTHAKTGIRYEYAVCTCKRENGKTILSPKAECGEAVLCLPAVPYITDMTLKDGNTVITWTPVKKASGYRIERRISGSSEWETVKEVPAKKTKFAVEGGNGEAEYTVRTLVKKKGVLLVSEASPAVSDGGKALDGKKILFIGDSITWGYAGSKRQADVTFPERVSQLTGAVCINEGIPNCNFARKKLRDADSIVSRTQMGVLNYYGYDMIVFACGTNDFSHNVKLGEYADKRANTFCGAINEMIKEAQTQNPKAEIILMTPILRCRDNAGWYETNGYQVKNARGFTLADYCSAMKKLAKKNHVRCYDSEKKKVFTNANVKRLLADGLHPTQAGYIALGESFAQYLEKDIKKD